MVASLSRGDDAPMLDNNNTEMPARKGEIDQESALRLLALIQGHWAAGVVGALARLEVVDHLKEGAREAAEIAAATGLQEATMSRLLRAATFLGVLEQPEPGRFTAAPMAAALRSGGRTFRELAIALTDPGVWRAWEQLPDALVGNYPTAGGERGAVLWEYFARNPEERARFAAAMGSMSARHSESVLALVDATRFQRIVDVGGSHGALLSGLVAAAPDATGILFDLPATIAQARAQLSRSPAADRIELVAGDFFEAVPKHGDMYVLKGVLLDWNDEDAARILASCHAAAAPGARIWVIEALLPEPPATSWVNLLDLNMLVLFGGHDRTLAQYQHLLADAGWRAETVTALVDDHALIEAVRQ